MTDISTSGQPAGHSDNDEPEPGHNSNRAIIAALAANTFIALLKFAGWGLTGVSSMLAEAIHSVADTGNQFLLLVGGRRAQKAATEEHPFGYGRERYVFAFMVAIVMFSIGGVFALYEAWHKLQEVLAGEHHDMGRWWWVPVVILIGAICAEGLRCGPPCGSPTRHGAGSGSSSTSARRRHPSCRWWCWRIPRP
ncbi:hypothetical protein GCM10027613_07850 [Microlunatus endophyticus]